MGRKEHNLEEKNNVFENGQWIKGRRDPATCFPWMMVWNLWADGLEQVWLYLRRRLAPLVAQKTGYYSGSTTLGLYCFTCCSLFLYLNIWLSQSLIGSQQIYSFSATPSQTETHRRPCAHAHTCTRTPLCVTALEKTSSQCMYAMGIIH